MTTQLNESSTKTNSLSKKVSILEWKGVKFLIYQIVVTDGNNTCDEILNAHHALIIKSLKISTYHMVASSLYVNKELWGVGYVAWS